MQHKHSHALSPFREVYPHTPSPAPRHPLQHIPMTFLTIVDHSAEPLATAHEYL